MPNVHHNIVERKSFTPALNADEPFAECFEGKGEYVTPAVGIVKAARTDGLMLVHIPTGKAFDGFYFDRTTARNAARRWSKKPKRLQRRLAASRLLDNGEGCALAWN